LRSIDNSSGKPNETPAWHNSPSRRIASSKENSPPASVRKATRFKRYKAGLCVAEDGSVKDATVAESSGDPDLDRAAVNCVSSWRYYPAKENGNPIEFDLKTVVPWRRRFQSAVTERLR
jgi:protein TonB